MKQVTIHEAKTHLSHLIQLALQGEEVIIARGSVPLITLQVLPQLRNRKAGGAVVGQFEIYGHDILESMKSNYSRICSMFSRSPLVSLSLGC